MLSFLKDHPFAVETFFESSLVLAYAVPKEALRHLLPDCLEPDTFEDKWGFVAVAMVHTRDLRPKGFPAFMGNDFFLTGYRIFVRYTTSQGKRLRGLYILKSETDKEKMSFLGNIFTHYKYTTTDITYTKQGSIVTVSSKRSDLDVRADTGSELVSLPPHSPFHDWKEARRYAGPLPFTFTYNAAAKEVVIIEGVRQHWEPRAVEILNSHVGFLDSLQLGGMVLANAFIINDVPYYWKKGKKDKWQG